MGLSTTFVFMLKVRFVSVASSGIILGGRVLTHVMSSSDRCKTFDLAFTEPLGDEEYLGLEATSPEDVRYSSKTGHPPSYVPFPPVRLRGPLREEAMRLGVSWSHGLCCGPGSVRRKRGENGAAIPKIAPRRVAVTYLDDPDGPDVAMDCAP